MKKLECNMKDDCTSPITHIDEKGFIYCKEHGLERKQSHRKRCRQLKPKELKDLQSGKQLKEY